jgi:tRNA(His) 5'-end guanylyltransferase
MTISDRFQLYEKNYAFQFTRKLPIVVKVRGKNFTRLTKLLTKPFSTELCKVFAESLLYSISELQGCLFGYTFSDEVNFILTNDQTLDTEPWLDNKIQEIISVVSSVFTTAFYKNQLALDLDMPLVGDALFRVNAFPVPNYTEVINYIAWRQIIAYKLAVSEATNKELLVKFDENKIESIISNKTTDERKDILQKHCGIDFEQYYPSYWYRGIGAYRTNVNKEGPARFKWSLDWELPFFMKNKELLTNIFVSKE